MQSLNVFQFPLIGIVSLIITIMFGKQFDLLKIIWVPHGVFHWVIVSSFLLLVILNFLNDWKNSLFVGGMLLLLVAHQLLGLFYPKNFRRGVLFLLLPQQRGAGRFSQFSRLPLQSFWQCPVFL